MEVRPGLTGLAQVSGRGELPHDRKLEIDVQYVEQASLLLDLRVLWRSMTQIYVGRKAYQKWD